VEIYFPASFGALKIMVKGKNTETAILSNSSFTRP